MMTWLPILRQLWPYALIASLSAVCALLWHALQSEREAFAAYRLRAEMAAEVAAATHASRLHHQARITQETADGWKAALDYVRAHPPRVRTLPASGGNALQIPAPAAGADGPGADPISHPGELAAQCAETTLTLNWLQNWVSHQEAVR